MTIITSRLCAGPVSWSYVKSNERIILHDFVHYNSGVSRAKEQNNRLDPGDDPEYDPDPGSGIDQDSTDLRENVTRGVSQDLV